MNLIASADAARSPVRKLRVISAEEMVEQVRGELSRLRESAIRLESEQAELQESIAKRSADLFGTRKERFHRPASWLRAPLAAQIADSGWVPLGRRAGESRASAVARWSLTYPYFTKSQECAAAASRAAGVEYRMPLLDRRVLEPKISYLISAPLKQLVRVRERFPPEKRKRNLPWCHDNRENRFGGPL